MTSIVDRIKNAVEINGIKLLDKTKIGYDIIDCRPLKQRFLKHIKGKRNIIFQFSKTHFIVTEKYYKMLIINDIKKIMKANIFQIIKEHRKQSGYGYSIVNLKYRGYDISVPTFPLSALESAFDDINEKLKKEIPLKKISRNLKKELGAEIRVLVNPNSSLYRFQFVVFSYFYKNEKQNYVSCYPSQNKGNIKPVYGDIDELRADLRSIL